MPLPTKTTTLPLLHAKLKSLTPHIKSLGVTHLSIIGSYALVHRSFSEGGLYSRPAGPLPSDLDILCHWKSKQKWVANSNALSEYLSANLKIKIDLTAPFHHRNQPYKINKIPCITIF